MPGTTTRGGPDSPVGWSFVAKIVLALHAHKHAARRDMEVLSSVERMRKEVMGQR